ncbi:MAG: response regulator [Pseudomonadota bacterium]
MLTDYPQRALVLAPVGRDARIAAEMLGEANCEAQVCESLDDLVNNLGDEAGFALVAEEALARADLRPLKDWILAQPEWSDFPFILITHRGGGLERNPAAGRHLQTLGNVAFIERPFHPTTLVSLADAALRGRRRQFEARMRLEALAESEARIRAINQSLEHLVTERTAALSEREARMRAIFETNHQYQWFLAVDGTLLDANSTALADVAAAREQVIGLPFWETPWLTDAPEAANSIREAIPKVVSGDNYREEIVLRLPHGHRSVDLVMRPVRDQNGHVSAIVPQAIDITDRRLAEQALRQSQKLEAMGQLTGGVAHDFNNLLTPIIGSLDLLQRNETGTARERRAINGALEAAERAKVLVQRLLAFARRQPLRPQPVDLSALVRGMGGLIHTTVGSSINVVIDTPEDVPTALADGNQLEMALLNLCVNARDAMPRGGVLRLAVSLERLAKTAGSPLAPGSYVRLSIADTGNGMDEATLARAVEPFFTTKDIGQGTGLGLSMAHGLALQLGGALTISSQQGLGTTIDLWLPVTGSAQPAPVQRPVVVAEHLGTVLLVDDDALVRTSTAAMLNELGFDVVEAASAQEAVAQLESPDRFGLLITDYMMPGLSGIEVAEMFQRKRPTAPVLIITGYADVNALPAHQVRLAKPFRQIELAKTIASLRIAGEATSAVDAAPAAP